MQVQLHPNNSKPLNILETIGSVVKDSQSMSKCQTHLRVALNSGHENLSERRKSEHCCGKRNTVPASCHQPSSIRGNTGRGRQLIGLQRVEEDLRLTKLFCFDQERCNKNSKDLPTVMMVRRCLKIEVVFLGCGHLQRPNTSKSICSNRWQSLAGLQKAMQNTMGSSNKIQLPLAAQE